MDKWLGHISDSPTSTERMTRKRAAEGYEWRNVDLRLGQGDLQQKSDEARHLAGNPLQNVDVMKAGLHIWRVKDSIMEPWRQECYGHFYDQDCFLILQIRNTLHPGDKPSWNIHLWAGKWVPKEEYRMAVFKAVLLNSALSFQGVFYREPQGKETTVFRKYFAFITYYKGTADDSYWSLRLHGNPHTPRLLKMYIPDSKLNQYRVTEVPGRHDQLNNSFVYILDRGDILHQWNGELCTTEDVTQASRYVQYMKATRGINIKVDILNDKGQDEAGHPFYMFLSHTSYMTVDDADDDEQRTLVFNSSKRRSQGGTKGILYRVVHHATKGVQFKKIKEGVITIKELNKEVFAVVEVDGTSILWSNQKTVSSNHSEGIEIIHEYFRLTNHVTSPSVVLCEGQTSPLLQVLRAR